MNRAPDAAPAFPLTAAPHRTMFFAGLLALLAASAWWGLHLVARHFGTPLFALMVEPAPIWAHAYLMLFAVFPTVFFGFLFTVFPRWMNGPLVTLSEYVTTGLAFTAGTLLWLVGTFTGKPLLLGACFATGVGLLTGTGALFRVLVGAPKPVSHAVVVLIALCVQLVALAGFAYGVAEANDFALHFAVRTSLWGGLLPVFFAVCHRMVPFFSQGAVLGYAVWRPTWVLVAVIATVYLRLLLGAVGTLDWLPLVDAVLFGLTALCALRWTDLRARGNALLWTLYAGFAWLPVAALLQLVRDLSFTLTGEWALGRAPVHALGMGFFGGLLVAMVTRVTMGHSGRPLKMDRRTLGCFIAIQVATVARILGEVVEAPLVAQCLVIVSLLVWLAAIAVWTGRVGGIYLTRRIDGRPG